MFKVCCLTRTELHLYVTRDQLPDCANANPKSENSGKHAHIKSEKAWQLVGKDDGTGEAIWIGSGCKMIYQTPPKVWKGKDSSEYSNRERIAATRVMQMVEVRPKRLQASF